MREYAFRITVCGVAWCDCMGLLDVTGIYYVCKYQSIRFSFPPMAPQPLGGLGRLIFRGFTITLYRHTTLGRTPLDEWSARRRDLYLTTHNTQGFTITLFRHTTFGRTPLDEWSARRRDLYLTTHNTQGFTIPRFRHTTFGRTPLDEWSARRRDLYLTTHNTHNRQTSMPPVEFEPTIPVSERPKTHALDRTATGIGGVQYYLYIKAITKLLCTIYTHVETTFVSSERYTLSQVSV
jgi:hypothetical protein